MKTCKRCGSEKENTFFREKRIVCKDCLKKERKIYYYENREKINEYKRNEYKEKGEKLREKNRISYSKHKEKRKEQAREYLKNNYEKIMEYHREYNQRPERKIGKKAIRDSRRIIKNSGEKVTRKMLIDLLDSQNGKCNYYDVFLDFNIKFFVHLDHIIPLCKEGEHKISNLQYLCQACNLHKSDKILIK